MSKKIILTIAVLLSTYVAILAQSFTAIIPAKTMIIKKDTNLYLGNGNLGTTIDSSILICGDWTVYLSGQSTHIPRIYLEETAHLVIVDTTFFCFWADIFMKNNTTYDHNNHMCGDVDSIVKMPTAVLTDTGVAVQHLVPVTNLIFDYSLLPGGVAPCNGPSATTSISKHTKVVSIQNPIQDKIVITNYTHKNYLVFEMYNILGQKIMQQNIQNENTIIPLPVMPRGLYLYHIVEQNNIVQQGKLQY